MSSRKTFEEYQEEYRRAIAQRDREDEELLMKLTSDANQYKADFEQKIKTDHKKTYEASKHKQVELYEKLSSTSDLKTWERILNMCDVEHPPENTDLSTLVDVMKKMDSRITEKPEPVPIKRGEVHFEEEAPSPVSGSATFKSANTSMKSDEKGGDGGLFDFADDDFISQPPRDEKHEESSNVLEEKNDETSEVEKEKESSSSPSDVSEEHKTNANGALDDLFGFNGENSEEKDEKPETQDDIVEKENEEDINRPTEEKEGEMNDEKEQQMEEVVQDTNGGDGDDFENMFD